VFLISLLVLVPVAYVLWGRDLPAVVVDLLNQYIPNDTAPSEELVAWAMLAGAAVGATPIHKLIRYLATVVHELGHAFTAGILGGRPKHITISTDTSGLAVYEPPVHWGRFRASVVSAAGYPAPAIASLAAIEAIQAGHSKAWVLLLGWHSGGCHHRTHSKLLGILLDCWGSRRQLLRGPRVASGTPWGNCCGGRRVPRSRGVSTCTYSVLPQ